MDASAVVLGLLNDGDSRAALATEAIACPHLIDAEVLHALRGQVQRKTIKPAVAKKLVTTWSQLGIQRVATVGLLDRVWQLRDNVSAYDATYVALAEALECGLMTADRRLAQAPGPRCPITVVRS